jgi:Family of unknown function (DUF6807)
MFHRHLVSCLTLACVVVLPAHGADWTLSQRTNPDGPGKAVDIQFGGSKVARFIHGEGQFKPYLHVFGEAGELVTNGGLDANGKPTGQFPHHRGIFIGWNKIASDLGTFDLWHFNNGGKMEVLQFDKLEGGKDAAILVATIAWRAGKKDDSGSDLLLTETRTLRISRPEGKTTQVDAHFRLKAARELTLGGDLQHAGIHFRASNEVSTRAKETSYVSDPEDKETKGKDWTASAPKKDKDGNEIKPAGEPVRGDLNWCRLLFPIGERWYAATELNAPSNPVEELSWRDYGRFGFFFKRKLAAGETLDLNYRFFVEPAEAPISKPKPSAEQSAKTRAEAQRRYREFVGSVKR